MEPIQPEYLWECCPYGDALPEAELICATIHQAYLDSRSRNPVLRNEARRWFHTIQFKEYCKLVGLNALDLHEYVIWKWNDL